MMNNKALMQIIWGSMLVIAGVGVFFRLPHVMPKIAQIEFFTSTLPFIRFCFYLIGCLLIGGGLKKLIDNYKVLAKNK
jgi:hypothetical protein